MTPETSRGPMTSFRLQLPQAFRTVLILLALSSTLRAEAKASNSDVSEQSFPRRVFSINDNGNLVASYDEDELHRDSPCISVACSRGRRCIVVDDEPVCVCLDRCPTHYRPVCGTDGMIYPNHCHLHRRACIDSRRIHSRPMIDCLQPPTTPRRNGHRVHHRTSPSPAHLNANPSSNHESRKASGTHHQSQISSARNDATKNNKEANNTQQVDADADRNKTDQRGNQNPSSTGSSHHDLATPPRSGITTGQPYEPKPPSIDVSGGGDTTTAGDVIKGSSDFTSTESDIVELEMRTEHICPLQSFQQMKELLLDYSRNELQHSGNASQGHSSVREYIISRMFSRFDINNNGQLELTELQQMSKLKDMASLQPGCDLTDLAHFDDISGDGALDVNEFYDAFNKHYSIQMFSLDKALQLNQLTALVGDNVEIKCDITGSPTPHIVWTRSGQDLSRMEDDSLRVFYDGSLYLSHVLPVHAGNYSCHARDNTVMQQTHVLTVHVPPTAEVDVNLQNRGVGQLARIHCHVQGNPEPQISWLKNESPIGSEPGRYDVTAGGSVLRIGPLTVSDTGAYMCQAGSIAGRARAVSSLLVQTRSHSDSPYPEPHLMVFHDWGISVYDPSSCRLEHQIEGSNIIPGSQVDYVCGSVQRACDWGGAVTVGDDFVYVSQPRLQRVLVISRKQRVAVDVIGTDQLPVKLEYVPHLDQVWVLNWRTTHNSGVRTVQVIRNASKNRRHHTVHLQPLNDHVDLVADMFIPPSELPDQKFAYITHSNHRGMYKIDMSSLDVVKSIDLSAYNCVPQQAQFAKSHGYLILSCSEPVTGRSTGQLLFDQLTDSVMTSHKELQGRPLLTPDSASCVTLTRTGDVTTLTVQRLNGRGLVFAFDVRTPLNISDVTFHPSQSGHGYDLYATAAGAPEVMLTDLQSGRVEILTGIGHGLPVSSEQLWGGAKRPLLSAGRHQHRLAAADGSSLVILDTNTRTETCHVAGLRGIAAPLWLPIIRH